MFRTDDDEDLNNDVVVDNVVVKRRSTMMITPRARHYFIVKKNKKISLLEMEREGIQEMTKSWSANEEIFWSEQKRFINLILPLLMLWCFFTADAGILLSCKQTNKQNFLSLLLLQFSTKQKLFVTITLMLKILSKDVNVSTGI